MIKVSAPGKVILFGEHAVVYDRLGIAGAINRRIKISADFGNNGINIIQHSEYSGFQLSKEDLFLLLEKFKEYYKDKNFEEIKKFSFNEAIAVVIAEILKRYGFKDLNIGLTIKDSKKSIGQSASIFSGITLAINNLLNLNLSKKEVADIAYLGDVVAHGGTPSGIDTNTIVYGGYVEYKKSKGVLPLDIDFEVPLVIVDSGEPSKTNITVPFVRKLKEEDPDYVVPILDEINNISSNSIQALKNKNLEKIGQLMIQNHILLQKLGVSSKKLDELVSLALNNNALGAKLTAGGGGGCIIVLSKDQEHADNLIKIYEGKGYKAFQTRLGSAGVREEN